MKPDSGFAAMWLKVNDLKVMNIGLLNYKWSM